MATKKNTKSDKQSRVAGIFLKLKQKIDKFLSRRPHRSFRRTKRRDYIKPLRLPGYFAFSMSVFRFVKKNKKILILNSLIFALLTGLLVGLASQDTYTTLTDLLKETGGEIIKGNFGQLNQAAILLTTVMTGGLSGGLNEAQQIYAVLLSLLTWLSTVWILRGILNDKKIKLRDALYNSGAPIVSTILVFLFGLIQLLPLAIVAIAYIAAVSTGLLNGGVEAMLFWLAAGLLTTLSLYWVTSTFIALIIVSLPGAYPYASIQAAGDLVIGRRIRILLRILWMILGVFLTWVVIMIPIIIFDLWFKSLVPAIVWLPIVPIAILILSSMSVVWMATYIYMLYRKIIENDTES